MIWHHFVNDSVPFVYVNLDVLPNVDPDLD